MNKNWYICALVIILALLGGITTQEQNQTPNQEIVLQFSDTNITQDDAQIVISDVKQQLSAIGVFDIQVTNLKDGSLRISYFSDTDTTSIKKLLSESSSLEIENNDSDNIPSENHDIIYNFDIYELHEHSEHGFHLSGKLGIEHKSGHDRIINPDNLQANSQSLDYVVYDIKFRYEFQCHLYNDIALTRISYEIPEVRAGPAASGIIVIS